ncbi:hypothetical protein AA3271_0903 [Gluconobacter japonicus NBRC 3271]|nr:hypothetical protein AA3271_0903 [Gluconobacter japonicus NBRC 3271]
MLEVRNHLACNVRGPGGDATLNNTMIARENCDLDFIQNRAVRALPFTKPERKFFKSPQAAGRFGQ